MINTTIEVPIEPIEAGVKKKIYLESHSPNRQDKGSIPTVTYTISMYTMEGEEGNQKLVPYQSSIKTARFRLVRWLELFGNYTPNELAAIHDQKFIENISFVNEREINEEWTGNEIQRVSFWAKYLQENSGGFEIYNP